MVILPTEKRFDWKYAPVMLFTLVLANVLVFFLYQSQDDGKFEQAWQSYADHDLLANEWPAFQTYLEEADRGEELDLARELHEAGDTASLIGMILGDDPFYDWANEHSHLLSFDAYDEADSWDSWRRHRDEVNSLLHSISALQAGLVPSSMTLFTLLSYQFLHGDFMHLLGNMVFLVFCGFAVEAAIGPWIFLGLYLISGIASGLLFALIDLSSTLPLVGASGSISGVMAMYLGIFRLRRIEFFYWIFVFAGYFRAPALLILPLYVGNELLNYFLNPDSNVAFMAHAGGFLCGGALVATLHKLRPGIFNEQYIEENQDLDPEREARARVYDLIDRCQFDRAIEAIGRFNEQFGADFDLLALSYQLAHATRDPLQRSALEQLLRMKPHDQQQVAQLALACEHEPDLLSWLDQAQAMKLALNLSTPEHIPLAERIFNHYHRLNAKDPALAVLARKLALTFEQLKQPDRKCHYESIADSFIRGAF
jgi:membrane associated rhomboid family serine protease